MEPQPPKPIERHGIRRGIYILPSLFTVGTLLCGYYAILSTQRASAFLAAAAAAAAGSKAAADLTAMAVAAIDNASKALGWAIVADGFDGRIARMTNTASPFGRELDSLADIVAFGVAPAALAFVWGIRALGDLSGYPYIQHIPDLAWILTFGYVICGAARLARFNVDTVKPTSDRRFFVGMPIPAGAGFVAAVVHFYKSPADFLAVFRGLAGDRRNSGFPHGQPHALLQLQDARPSQAPFLPGHHPDRPDYRGDLVLLGTRPADHCPHLHGFWNRSQDYLQDSPQSARA